MSVLLRQLWPGYFKRQAHRPKTAGTLYMPKPRPSRKGNYRLDAVRMKLSDH